MRLSPKYLFEIKKPPIAAVKAEMWELPLGRNGMFYHVGIVAHLAHLAQNEGREFWVTWDKGLYFDPVLKGNPWLYYFDPVFPNAPTQGKPFNVRNYFPKVDETTEHYINPRLINAAKGGLELPKDRAFGEQLLTRFVRPNATVRAFVDDFADAFFKGPVIGLHLRGRGRIHGGVPDMRRLLDPDNPIPYEHYFAAVDKALEKIPTAQILACSDSQEVIDNIIQRYGSRVLVYPSSRSSYGEMHENNKDQTFSPFKLGLDVLVEAHLLARSEHFVHGNSAVSNYVLCLSPAMDSTYVYAGVLDEYMKILRADGEVKWYER